MNRRGFLGALLAAPIAPVAAALPLQGFTIPAGKITFVSGMDAASIFDQVAIAMLPMPCPQRVKAKFITPYIAAQITAMEKMRIRDIE